MIKLNIVWFFNNSERLESFFSKRENNKQAKEDFKGTVSPADLWGAFE